MAIASISSQDSSSWSTLEQKLTDLKTWEAAERITTENNISELLSDLLNTTQWTGNSTSYLTYSGNGYTASITGSNFHKSSAKVTSASITDSNNRNLSSHGLNDYEELLK
jgi:hypothetical protein